MGEISTLNLIKMAKETFYFSHDYNARSDTKIKKLIVKHGFAGYGLYWAIVEDLYQNANALRTDYDCIAYDMRTDVKTVKSIIEDFELFEIQDGYFGSLSIQRRIEERDAKSQKARESAFFRWNKNKTDANAIQTHSEGNAIKDNIVKEIKVNESKENIFDAKSFLLQLFIEKQIAIDFLKNRKAKRLANTETAFKQISDEINKTGLTANDCIKIAVENGWGGFKANWLNNLQNGTNKQSNSKNQGASLEQIAAIADRVFGDLPDR